MSKHLIFSFLTNNMFCYYLILCLPYPKQGFSTLDAYSNHLPSFPKVPKPQHHPAVVKWEFIREGARVSVKYSPSDATVQPGLRTRDLNITNLCSWSACHELEDNLRYFPEKAKPHPVWELTEPFSSPPKGNLDGYPEALLWQYKDLGKESRTVSIRSENEKNTSVTK